MAKTCLIVFLFSTAARADDSRADTGNAPWDPSTHRGLSLQVLGGPLFSPFLPESNRESLLALPVMLRLGWSFGPLRESSPNSSGRFELLLEASYARILDGPGRFITGSSALVRYNTRPLAGRIVPYLQAGAGLSQSDIARDRDQRLTGQRFNFTLQLGAGLRIPIAKRWSLDTELHYFHLSNASLDERNLGLDSLGGMIGVTRYFGGP